MTKNEESNIRECLESVKWANEIIIVDSHSTDRTVEISSEYTDKIYQYTWDGKHPKKAWSLETPRFSYDWILMLDADERATPEFAKEIKLIVSDRENRYAGYLVRYHYWFLGRCIRFGDPVRKLVLFRKTKAYFERYNISGASDIADLEIGHEHPIIKGKVGHTRSFLLHKDTRDLYFYFNRHNRYSSWEAYLIFNKLYKSKKSTGIEGKLRGNFLEFRRFLKRIFLRLPFKPFVYFIYSYLFRLGFLDGYSGLCYNICKAIYAYQIGLKVHELKIRQKKKK